MMGLDVLPGAYEISNTIESLLKLLCNSTSLTVSAGSQKSHMWEILQDTENIIQHPI